MGRKPSGLRGIFLSEEIVRAVRARVITLVFVPILLSLWSISSFARMNYIEVSASVSQSDIKKYRYIAEIDERTSKIFRYVSFSIIRLEGESYCDKARCITYVIQNCDEPTCSYATALAGPLFAISDIPTHNGTIYDRYAELLSFCSGSSADKGVVAARFLVGEQLITLRSVSSAGCD